MHTAWSNVAVLRACKLLLVHNELTIRRLKWLQAIVHKPRNAGAMLATCFARANWDLRAPMASPWDLQLKDDQLMTAIWSKNQQKHDLFLFIFIK